jgi:hypothetical protein
MGTNSWELRKSKVGKDEMKKIMSALPRGAPPKKRQIEEKSDAVDETNFKKLKKKAKKRCSIEGCDKQAQNGGVCIKHGATKKRCSIEGCDKQAQNGGVCIKHGATKKRCSIEGCDKQAVNGRVCIKHGATNKQKRCSIEGCDKQAQNGGVCKKHGATKKDRSA